MLSTTVVRVLSLLLSQHPFEPENDPNAHSRAFLDLGLQSAMENAFCTIKPCSYGEVLQILRAEQPEALQKPFFCDLFDLDSFAYTKDRKA